MMGPENPARPGMKRRRHGATASCQSPLREGKPVWCCLRNEIRATGLAASGLRAPLD